MSVCQNLNAVKVGASNLALSLLSKYFKCAGYSSMKLLSVMQLSDGRLS